MTTPKLTERLSKWQADHRNAAYSLQFLAAWLVWICVGTAAIVVLCALGFACGMMHAPAWLDWVIGPAVMVGMIAIMNWIFETEFFR